MSRSLVSFLALITLSLLIGDLRAEGQARAAERRIALLVGNSDYQHFDKLVNPRNDGAAMAKLLRDAGFEIVEEKGDLGVAQFRHELADFEEMSRDADIAVVFYSGHGIEFSGRNYLIPIDATLRRTVDLPDEAISLDRVLDAVSGARKLKLVILDACRDDPFKGRSQARGAYRGLAPVEPTEANELISYSAKAGSIAKDGIPGGNSPFTTALLKRLTIKGLDVELALRQVRDDVLRATHREQEPFYYGSMSGSEVPLVPAETATASPLPTPVAELPPSLSAEPVQPKSVPTPSNPTPTPEAAEVVLCGEGVRHANRNIVDKTATVQLASFLEGLKSGKYVFNYGIEGTDAAKQLDFDIRFATIYNEVSDAVKAGKITDFNFLIKYIESILEKEKAIDAQINDDNTKLSAIIYLRSYQSLQCSFPNIIIKEPSADVVLNQIQLAYPNFRLENTRTTFRRVYAETNTMLHNEADKKGTYSAFQTIQFMRDVILRTR